MTVDLTRPPPPDGTPAPPAPVLRGSPVVGLTLRMLNDPLAVMTEVAAACGPVGAFRLGGRTAVVVSGPDAARDVLVSRARDFDKGRLQRRALQPTLRNGLLISEGELHTRQRKVVTPHFVPQRIAHFVPVFADEALKHSRRWADGQEVDLLGAMGAITRDVIGQLLWSRSLEDEQALADAVTRVFEWEMHALLSPAPAPLAVPTPRNRRLHRDIGFVRHRIGEIVAERRGSDASENDLLAALLATRYEDGSAMGAEQLLDEVVTLWGAAHETSADAQFWTAYLLARHPDVLARVRAEVDEVLGDRLPTAEDLPRLGYCLQVFKEAMRLYPPAASMLREAARDTVVGGVAVRRGSIVFVAPYALHRSPEFYPDPMAFDPERFTPEAERARHRFAYLPFGAGPHVCVGGALALTEGQVFTAVLSRRVSFELTDPRPVQPQLLINLRPRGTVRAVVRRRMTADGDRP